MWLLRTDGTELREFHGPDDPELQKDGGYAILSHVWGPDKEQSFKDTQSLCAAYKEGKETTPFDRASTKVSECCRIARLHGFEWVWDDTCCINKDSSSELSEAINSMFRYYSSAKVCFAYLRDVPHAPRSELEAPKSPFRESVWHTRGWTLQELIAPPFLVFLSDDWNLLGTKMELAELLTEITRIPVDVLRLAKPVDKFSVACRMSWAAERVTTRVEDIAYCLMGIFLINMPTMYGEEERAFVRLQEAIMKQSVDTSLFVWEEGYGFEGNIKRSHREYADPNHEGSCDHTILAPQHFLLAPSPKVFLHSTPVEFDENIIHKLQSLGIVKAPARQALATDARAHSLLPCIPSFSVTPYGVHAHVPIMDVHAQGFSIAWLGCVNTSTKDVIGLCIIPCNSPLDPTRQLYHTGCPGTLSRTTAVAERFSDSLLWRQNCAEWRYIHIANRPPPSSTINLYTPSDYTLSPPFRFHMQDLKTCLGDHGFLVDVSQVLFNWDGSSPVVFKFHALPHEYALIKVYMVFGRCSESVSNDRDPSSAAASTPRPHWAFVLYDKEDRDFSDMPSHVCPKDHIAAWPGRSRIFSHTDPVWKARMDVTLSFLEDRHSPASTLVLRVKHDVEIGRHLLL